MLLPMVAMADAVEIDGINYKLNAETKTAEVVISDCSGSIVIPEKVTHEGTEFVVTKIGDSAFSSGKITSITIPNSVTSIERFAFRGCGQMTSITFGNGLTSIGAYAFDYCIGLTSITIPDNVTGIGDFAFRNCSGLTSITIPKSVTYIGGRVFLKCSSLTSIKVESGNTTYDSRDNCNAIIYKSSNTLKDGCKNTTIPSSVTSISNYAFSYCSGLTSITIPNSVTRIGEYAFDHCSGLTSITIPNSVTSIGNYAFWFCSGLTSITIPNSVTSIEKYTFSICRGLTSVTIPNSVTSIGNGAFSECSGLTSITIPNSVTSIGQDVFSNCSGLNSIKVESGNTKYDSRDNCNAIIETTSNTLIYGCKNTTIPNNVTSIEKLAFCGCTGLTSIAIPNSMKSIGNRAFFCCSGLTSITIPNSVTSIGENAFASCSGLTSITIGNSVTSIEAGAFQYCSGLLDMYCYAENVPTTVSNAFNYSNIANATLHVPAGSIGNYQAAEPWNNFWAIVALSDEMPPEDIDPDGNGMIDDIEIGGIYYDLVIDSKEAIVKSNPNQYQGNVTIAETVNYGGMTYSVTSIGGYAFSWCSSMTSIIIPNSVTSIGEWAFSWCSGLTLITIPNSVTSIGDLAFFSCNGLTSIKVESGNTKYDSRNNCNAIIETTSNTLITGCQNTTIPNSVTGIGDGAFYGCSGLTLITIPNSVTSIGGSAFSGCSGLTSINVESGNTKYDSRDNCNAIIETTSNSLIAGCQNTTIPGSVTSIGSYAFDGCSGLTSVTIPNSVTSIGYCAFRNCYGLKSITIGNSVTSIGYLAFDGCRGLSSITIPNNVTSIGQSAFHSCSGLLDMFCYAENVPTTGSYAFKNSNIANATLHVPAGSVGAYQAADQWKNFKEIVALSGSEMPKCATPTISFIGGKLHFECVTKGVEFHYEFTTPASGNGTGNNVAVSSTYVVNVYASKAGYQDSEVAIANVNVAGIKGDVTGDGVVNVGDAVEVVNIIMGKDE